MARYFIGFLLAVGLIVLVIVLIVRGITSPHRGAPTQFSLNNLASSDVRVQLTLDSPVSAIQTHNDIVMSVGTSQSTITITQGYDGDVVSTKSYPMTPSAYGVFLRSLSANGFTKGNSDPALRNPSGYCALGDRFIYEAIDGSGNDLMYFWFTSCNNGTFRGNVSAVRRLFIAQYPDYSTFTSSVQL